MQLSSITSTSCSPRATAPSICTSFSSPKTISAFFGIELRRSPPLTSTMKLSVLHSFLKSSEIALGISLSISTPECPPARPLTWYSYRCKVLVWRDNFLVAIMSTPPAQPMVTMPSSSESRFNKNGAERSKSRPRAPINPTSSSAVKRQSTSAPSSINESIIAIPIPLSAPSVESLAESHPSFSCKSRGNSAPIQTIS